MIIILLHLFKLSNASTIGTPLLSSTKTSTETVNQNSTQEAKSIFGNYESKPKDYLENFDCSGDYMWGIEDDIDLSKASEDDIQHIISLKRVIHCYFYVIKKSLKSDIPKYISKYLVKDTLKQLKDKLYKAYDEYEDKSVLVAENDDVQRRRDTAERIIEQMTIAKRQIIATKNYYLED